MYLKAGTSEQRTSLIRVVSVGDVSIEETRKLYRSAEETLLISTRAMEYFRQVEEDLSDAMSRGVSVRILMRSPETLSKSDREKQESTLAAMRTAFVNGYEVKFSDEVEIRGCVVDPAEGGKALFLVEEEGVPFFLREAALTFHPGVAKALGAMFDLKWRFDSEPA
jgi:sugar-specific transcriptional regulator TrmB